MYPYHLANTLTNINNVLKMDLCYLVNALTNIIDKVNNCIKEKVDYI